MIQAGIKIHKIIKSTSFNHYWKVYQKSKLVPLRLAAKSRIRFWRCLWLVVLFICVGLSTWSCMSTIDYYFQYNVKTTIVTQKKDVLKFPAISMFNSHPVRRSAMNPLLLNIIAYVMAQSESALNQSLKNFNQTCKSPMNGSLFLGMKSKEFLQLTKHMTLDSFASVKRCWYRNVPLDCKRVFLNTYNEYSLAFTFNVDSLVLKHLQYDDEYVRLNATNVGPSNGFRVELDINHDELCGSFHKYAGAGFIAIVHDPVIVPAFYALAPAVYFSPGYFYDVGVKVQVINRKTKNLGYCNDRIGNKTNTYTYTKESCYLFCALQQIAHKCHCIVPPMKGHMSVVRGLDIPLDHYVECSSIDDLKCVSSLMSVIGNQNYCPYKCLNPCQEIKYQLQVKSTKYPSNMGFNNGTLRANFYIMEMMEDYIEESQGYVVANLALDIAGIIFTFLGLSLMNIAEGLFDICVFLLSRHSRKIQHKS